MIPAVKVWRVKVDNGTIYRVYAPTRLLAIMNLRDRGEWSPVVFCSVERKAANG